MSDGLRIIFLGTPDFAAASLEKLVQADFNVVAVVTAPDKPQGRGKKLGTSAVKECALKYDLPVLQPTNLKSMSFLEELRSFKADLQIVVAFRMLPEVVWNMPPLGTFNLHASLLPQYRGAAPINWAIINGESETGATTFFLKHEIDTGEVIFQEKESILPDDNVGTLYQRLMDKGADLVVKTTKAIQNGDYEQKPQVIDGELKHAPKIFKQDCEIDWTQSAKDVRNFVRGLSPYPAPWTKLEGKNLKVFQVEGSMEPSSKERGVFDTDNKTYLRIKTGDGSLDILELQLEGKKRMKTEDFLKGFKLTNS